MESVASNQAKNGKRNGQRFRGRKQKHAEKRTRDSNKRTPNYDEIIKENVNFESYYKAQQIMKTEEEWQQFMEILRKPLPSDFRISSNCTGQTEKMRDLIQNLTSSVVANSNEEGEEPAKDIFVSPIPWYPDNLAWTINLSKSEIRRTPSLKKLHQFLISETSTGDISRQEAVSMIPPLLLDIKPGQSVLDMCAAPGSKTAQIIEMLHRSSNNDFIVNEDGTTLQDKQLINGLVVANDVDNKRCYMLIHQSNRLHSPCVVIINHDAANLPKFYRSGKDNKKSFLKFDRILADVPCTGDGTVRKNYDVWTKWNAANSNNFHSIQLKIARRGVELLAKDGIMAYSTCSLNPAENEAVIASLLNSAQGDLELIDAAKQIPQLKCRPGLETWTVMSRDNTIYSSYDEVGPNLQSQIKESLFPPKNAAELNLKFCIRVLPHYQNTGGFFIAILRKKTDKMPWESMRNDNAENIETKKVDEPKRIEKKRKGFMGHREDPYFFLKEDDSDWPILKSFYDFPDSFSVTQLAHRCSAGKRRNIYFLTELATDFMANNPHVKVITGGSRIFNRVDVQNVKCPFRITQEGIPTLFPYFVTKLSEFLPTLNNEDNPRFNIIDIDREHFVKLLKKEDLKMEEFDDEVRLRIANLSHGSCILYLQLSRPSPNESSKYILPIGAWKGKNSIRAYVARNERAHILRLCDEEMEPTVQEDKGPDESIEQQESEESEETMQQNKKTKLEQSIED